ncbi:MmgE/PrpD family protein [Nakamurella sp. YIM 132087]|uniref:MmgE/PrpD family protein n=1 Tax=Nakamurella alba TaxID=2665158 RepID=A0A7K1FR95_9ACTN|nr:MmgE/PrpD family protein [Nakamurella alba]MTD15763.1 MmgE/PrpD family protein [Nakamurella alba]
MTVSLPGPTAGAAQELPDAGLVDALAGFATDALRRGIPDEVATSVQGRLLDVLGLCVAALPLPTSAAALDFVRDQGGPARALAIGAGRTSASWAAFGNGVLAHSLDYDDTHLPSVLHPSASVVPAALAAAQAADADGDTLLTAIAVGIEVCIRIGMAGYDQNAGANLWFDHGQHATSICGALGSAAAAAVAGAPAGMPDAEVRDIVAHALAVAASTASGIIEANRTGGTVKRLHCGWAAHSGVVAADLARRGLTGPPTALEGRFGLFEAFLRDAADPAAVIAGLGTDWAVPGVFFKPYPANHFTHTVVDAGRELAAQGLRPGDVAAVEIGVPSAIVRTIGEPLEVKQRPETAYQAQFSGPYAFAVGLFGGSGLGAGLSDYTDALAQDPARRALMATVTVRGDATCDAIYPHQFPAIARVRTVDGRELTVQVLENRGGPGNPLTDAELRTKFTDNCTAGGLGAGAATAISDAVFQLPGAGLDALDAALTAVPDTAS